MTIREALVREAHDGGCAHWPTPIRCERWVDSTLEASPILSALVDWADTSLEWMAAPDRDIADGLWRRQADTWQMLVELVREQTP